jgi:hypothetical protein
VRDPRPGRDGGDDAAGPRAAAGDAGGLGLVGQDRDQLADAPVPGPLVVPSPGFQVQDAAGVPDGQGADLLLDGPGDDGLGGLVLGLADPAPVPGLGLPRGPAVLAPPPRPPLPRPRRTAGRDPAAVLLVAQVLAVLGADRPARHQQARPARPGDRVRVDNPQVHPSRPGRVRALPVRVDRDRDLGGHVHVQPAVGRAEGHRPDPAGWVGDVPVQVDPQRRPAPRDRDRQHPAIEAERAVIPADRHQGALAPRVPRITATLPAAPGGGEPGVAVAAQHRPRSRRVKLPERARPGPGQFPAQLLVPSSRPGAALAPPPVHVQHAAPHVPGRAQQPEQPLPLGRRHAQPAPRRAVNHPRRVPVSSPRHETSKPAPTDKPPPAATPVKRA